MPLTNQELARRNLLTMPQAQTRIAPPSPPERSSHGGHIKHITQYHEASSDNYPTVADNALGPSLAQATSTAQSQ